MFLKNQRDLLESRNGQETEKEQLLIPVLNKIDDISPRHQSRSEDVSRYRVAGDHVEQELEGVPGKSLEQTPLPFRLKAVDDIGSHSLHRVVESPQHLGILLQITIEERDQIASSMGQTSHYGLVMPESPGGR